MVAILMMSGVVAALAMTAYSLQHGLTPDVERTAGRLWAKYTHETFADCPRENGIRFWLGCTDRAPRKDAR